MKNLDKTLKNDHFLTDYLHLGSNHLPTSLMADLQQDINSVSSFSKCLNETFPLRNCFVKIPNEKSNKYKSSLLSYLTKDLTGPYLQGNVPLRHLLNEETLFMS